MTPPHNTTHSIEHVTKRPALPLQIAERRKLLLAVDVLLVNLAVLASLAIWAWRSSDVFSIGFVVSQVHWFVFLSFLWLVAATITDLYDLSAAMDPMTTLHSLAWAMGLSLSVYLVIYFASPRDALPRLFILYFTALAFGSLTAWRLTYGRLFSRTAFRRRTLVVGAGWAGTTIVEAIQENFSAGYQLVGFVDDDPAKQKCAVHEVPVIGSRHNLTELIERHGISDIVVAVTGEMHAELIQALMTCQERGVRVAAMAQLYEELTGRVPVEHVGNHWHIMLPLDHPSTGNIYPGLKRAFDLLVASVGLLFFGLMLPFIALAVYVDSPGPLFYTQERVGKAGNPFRVFKIRSMRPNAETDGAAWAEENDPRVTRVGRLLRRASLDELPQFLNVLRGEMSIVGPRPERPVFAHQLAEEIPFYRLRHAVKPGMAGWALIHYGYSSSVEDALMKLQYDLYYIKHQSIFLDVIVLLRTIGRVLALAGR
ncbi:MAG: UDP-N-acetylgalactosamine-undecaprenyl-phosphate N-acetylgalactosaminephosphotransferase [Anaerolineales bacterium]|nr:UDP-N-acetylgalactosamine-undecaprenyl-phosphate N-acetylgalactosaminephosphotransferase [Anaerolineales bacterium]